MTDLPAEPDGKVGNGNAGAQRIKGYQRDEVLASTSPGSIRRPGEGAAGKGTRYGSHRGTLKVKAGEGSQGWNPLRPAWLSTRFMMIPRQTHRLRQDYP